jgi:hypothetical protein
MRYVVPLALLVVLPTLAGCSSDRDTQPAGGGSVTAAATPGIDPASRLDLDGGRVSVFSPQGWRRAPRSYDYLVRYQSTPQLPYPAVVVLAADPPADVVEVTSDNHAAFVEALAATLEAGDGAALLRQPAKATVGPHRAAIWSAAGEAQLDGLPKKIERECIAVVIDGRLYTVEAWAPRGKLTDAGREAARAVAAALAVPSLEPIESLVPAEPEGTEEPAEPEPVATEEPAEPEPAEPEPAEPEPAEPEPAEPEPAEPEPESAADAPAAL